MSLSKNAVTRLITALADSSSPVTQNAGNEVASAINAGIADLGGFYLPAVIVAAHVSATTDFAALAVGDYVVHIPAAAGNAIFYTVVTAGTLPAAAIVGDLYMVARLKPVSAPSAVSL